MTENEKVSLGLFHRYKWKYNLQREFKEAPLQYQTLASGVGVEGDNKKQHRLQAHTHTYTSTYLVDSTPCLFWKRKQCVTLHGSFSQQNLGSTKKSLGNTYVFDAGILPGRFPTNIVFSQKKKKQRVFLRFPMSHLME